MREISIFAAAAFFFLSFFSILLRTKRPCAETRQSRSRVRPSLNGPRVERVPYACIYFSDLPRLISPIDLGRVF